MRYQDKLAARARDSDVEAALIKDDTALAEQIVTQALRAVSL